MLWHLQRTIEGKMGDKIHQEEFQDLFGDEIPMEAVQLIWNSRDDMPISEVREKLREIARKTRVQYDPHPMQQVRMVNGVARFRENGIVRFLLDAGPFDLNQLALMTFSVEDRNQFAQLIGYSVSSFGDLDYAIKEVTAAADEEVEKLL